MRMVRAASPHALWGGLTLLLLCLMRAAAAARSLHAEPVVLSGGANRMPMVRRAHPDPLKEDHKERSGQLYEALMRGPQVKQRLGRSGSYEHIVLWDFYPPTDVCPTQDRLGRLGDGGKWVCMAQETLKNRECVVYSAGSEGETSFEQSILKTTDCKIWIFDPTLSPQAKQKLAPLLESDRVEFRPWGIGTHRYKGMPYWVDEQSIMKKSFKTIMQELGHAWVDVFKIDVEGSEWDVFPAIWGEKTAPFSQLLIELHLGQIDQGVQQVDAVKKFFSGAENHGFKIFHFEPNIYWSNPGSKFAEYAFVKTDENGDIITGPDT